MRTSDPAGARLDGAAAPGHRQLRRAAACQTLETMSAVATCIALAHIAQQALESHTRPGLAALGSLTAAGLLAAAAAWGAARSQAAGHRQIAGSIRRQLVAALLPSGHRAGDVDPATAALATVELADDIADHHAQGLPRKLSAPASMGMVFLVTGVVQWPAAVTLAVASLIIPVNMRLAGLLAKDGADEQAADRTRLAANVLDSFRGLRTLQGIGAVARRRGQLADASNRLNTTTMIVVRRSFLSAAVMDVVITFAIAVDATYIGLSLLGYVRLAGAPHVTLSSGLIALQLCPMYFAPLRARAASYHSRERATAAIPTITALLDASQKPAFEPAEPAAAPAMPVEIVLEDVHLRYPGSARDILAGVDLKVPAGRWTAIAGPSGVGKTSLLAVIAGAREPTSGTVHWATSTTNTHPHLGGCAWIGQQTVILPGSIADNIRVGRPEAPLAAVEYAAQAAGLTEVVARLPHGLDTPLGQGGWGLSAGEARRVAIARAFLRDAALWILDEPTAHLDPAAEAAVIQALRRAAHGRTVIVATHSAALAAAADTVLTVDGGTVRRTREAIRA